MPPVLAICVLKFFIFLLINMNIQFYELLNSFDAIACMLIRITEGQ